MFFFNGPVVDLIPNLAPFKIGSFTRNKSEQDSISVKVKSILNWINDRDSYYFETFKNIMVYGNHLDVQDAIIIANNQVLEAINNLPEFAAALVIMNDPEDRALVDSLASTGMASISNYTDGQQMRDSLQVRLAIHGDAKFLSLGIVLVAVFVVAVVAVAGLGIIAWREMAVWEEYNVPITNGGSSNYFYEQTIDQIVRL